MKRIISGIALVIALLNPPLSAISRDAAWSRMPQTTLAQRLSTKYDAQARALRYPSRRPYRKVPRRLFTRDIAQDYPIASTARGDATNIAPEHIGID